MEILHAFDDYYRLREEGCKRAMLDALAGEYRSIGTTV